MGLNSTIDLPESYDSLDQTLNTADLILSDAVPNATTLFHTPVVSSFNGKEIISRVMVLREFNLNKRLMRFHTDYRSAKIKQFCLSDIASVVGYDPDIKIQIKLHGKIKVYYDDDISKSAWKESSGRSKKCYSVKEGSTKEILEPSEYDIQDFEVEDGYKNFAVLIFTFDSLEFLYLKSSGHRRAIHKWKDNLKSTWLVP
ncbi:MAG: pyridoxamine 5'-phosphate oxidase [Gammaproteobacteria bacterium]|nr:pyridoxamine 5'-phosphate oxidase [Gammaproteobacteria bacterium]